jgi:hypothetical protein
MRGRDGWKPQLDAAARADLNRPPFNTFQAQIRAYNSHGRAFVEVPAPDDFGPNQGQPQQPPFLRRSSAQALAHWYAFLALHHTTS